MNYTRGEMYRFVNRTETSGDKESELPGSTGHTCAPVTLKGSSWFSISSRQERLDEQ